MTLGLAIYRTGASMAGSLAGTILARRGGAESFLSAGFRGTTPEALAAAGSIWVHAASLGEVGMARTWIQALLRAGAQTPVHLTTRTPAGLSRARTELGPCAAASFAPHDVPRIVSERFEAARPRRLDLIETELWPNLIFEARTRGVPVALVSATVSERTARRLLRLGLAGRDLFGAGVYALPQTELHAARFESLGIGRDRIRVIGDLKAMPSDRRPEPLPAFESRPALVYGSFRPGEERTARRLADLLESHRDKDEGGVAHGARRSVAPAYEGRSRALLVIAPRHRDGMERLRVTFRRAPFELVVRDDETRGTESVAAWIDRASAKGGPRVAVLATRGELPAAYEHAWGAVIGGTFAPYGGHNVWEPAARGCPVLVGPYREGVAAAVESVIGAGGGSIAEGGVGEAAAIVERWLTDPDLEQVGLRAQRAVDGAAGAADRGIGALADWGVAR